MDQISFEGKTYTLRGAKWTIGFEIVCETMQKKLNKAFEMQNDINALSFEELWEKGSHYKENGDYFLAIKYFEKALEKEPDRKEIRWMLASLSSCYRSIKQPKKSITLFDCYKNKKLYISAPLLTSVGAAYMDIEDVTNAKKMADRAFAITKDDGKEIDGELNSLYARIRKALGV